MQFDLEKAALFGFIGVILFSVSWLCAVISDPSWTLGENMVSDLGVSDTNAKYFFNGGCICSGAILAVYGLLSAHLTKPIVRKISYALIIVAGIALMGVGTFTEDTGWLHNTSAYAVFIAGVLSIILMIIQNVLNKELIMAIITAILIAVTIGVSFTATFPFLEAFAIVILLIWLGLVSLKTLFIAPKSDAAHIAHE